MSSCLFEDNRFYINEIQYFEGIDSSFWEFQYGGYRVLYKLCKDHQGKTLSSDWVDLFRRILYSMSGIKRLVIEIDGCL